MGPVVLILAYYKYIRISTLLQIISTVLIFKALFSSQKILHITRHIESSDTCMEH